MAISREILNGTNNNNGHEVVKPSVPLTVFLEDERAKKVELTGGKGASLAELRTIPEINVPDGFVITTLQSEKILQENPHIVNKIEVLDHHSLNWLRAKLRGDEKDVEFWGRQIAGSGDEAKEEMEKITLAITDENEIRDSYQKLCRKENQENVRVAVRSSGACEDGVEFSFAGQNSTFLHQEGEGEVIKSTIRCLASQFGKRVIQYRNDARFKLAQRALAENPKQSVANALKMSKSFSHIEARLATVVQVMVDGQASGVGFSVDSETGAKIVKLELTCGLGESLVSGSVTPDSYEVDPKTGIILARSLGEKAAKTVYVPGGTEEIETSEDERKKFAVSDSIVGRIAKLIATIRDYYGKEMDTEWNIDKNKINCVQARPDTVSSGKDQMIIEMKEFIVNDYAAKTAEIVVKDGRMGSPGATSGEIMSVENLEEAEQFLRAEENMGKNVILVTKMTTPDWVPVMKKVKGIITRAGGANCHAAIVCRELRVPCIVGIGNSIDSLKDITKITLDARNTTVYRGELPLEEAGENIDVREFLKEKTKTVKGIILANPDEAKKLHALAELGENFKVSLVRAEFLLGEIGVHVNALVDYDKGTLDEDLRVKVAEKLAGFGCTSGKEYFIAKYSEGISKFAALFTNSEIVLRTTDYKTNEYKELVGGRKYEANEENPMMGKRGLPRFLAPENREGFEWELEAIKKARDNGYKNIEIMFPMVRDALEMNGSVAEMEKEFGKGFRSVRDIMSEVGLERGKDELKVLIMVENPANVIMLDEFIDTGMIDEISIGSNDLTQFILGVDRDNEWLGSIPRYSEMNPAVIKSIEMALETCRRRGVKAGICGNGPSNHPELVDVLVKNEITSIGVTPDRLLATHRLIKEKEEKLSKEREARGVVLFNVSSEN